MEMHHTSTQLVAFHFKSNFVGPLEKFNILIELLSKLFFLGRAEL